MVCRSFAFILVLAMLFSACQHDYAPKPRGYFRIDFPEKSYHPSPDYLPYQFECPSYARLFKTSNEPDQKYWINIVFPAQKATVHLSYKQVQHNLDTFLNDSRNFVYKHTIKADAIVETPFVNDSAKVYGLLYEIKGDAASNLQFYLTDSTSNFVRGALYFNVVPNKDSLAPVLDFIEEDVVHLMETFRWQ